MSTPAQVARRVKRDLARLARPASEFDFSRYFRGAHGIGFYNTGMRAVREMAKAIHREHRHTWTVAEAMACADLLMPDRFLEVKGVAIALVALYRREFTPALLARWRRWLARGYSSNWATTDSICGFLIWPLVVQHPALAKRVASWAGHPSLWVRRASAVGLIGSLRRGDNLDPGFAVATRLRRDREDLVQKAVGWMLREAGNADPARLERYLRQGGSTIPRVTLRYAIEKFPAARRRAVLTATR